MGQWIAYTFWNKNNNNNASSFFPSTLLSHLMHCFHLLISIGFYCKLNVILDSILEIVSGRGLAAT